ncbi:venom allergen 5 2-like [Diorhabda carinulata]|uniref:venom allergen 5 2-like n=1 Tax=Diorhabda carinulata TaxID=1163345 RepID=UPI0025A29300|nr:venom allergen 5 2-like [Diorhabda carinulata]XP_057667615.1 venom allergen 5 2-like [Diorhabda carinulata]
MWWRQIEARTTVGKLAQPLIAIIALTLIGDAAACERTMLRTRSISSYDKQLILDLHNAMRQSIALGQIGGQPPAANMMEMKWDEELAERAQKWTQTCYSETHDHQRDVSRFPVGQNIATTWTTKPPGGYYDTEPDFADAISKWFNEYKSFHFGPIGRGNTGHYTQLIWAETNLIGCGYSFYYDPSKGYTKNYVCNYGPGGNVLGQPPYAKGYPNCNKNGLTESIRFSGLCDKPVAAKPTSTSNTYFFGFSNYLGRK